MPRSRIPTSRLVVAAAALAVIVLSASAAFGDMHSPGAGADGHDAGHGSAGGASAPGGGMESGGGGEPGQKGDQPASEEHHAAEAGPVHGADGHDDVVADDGSHVPSAPEPAHPLSMTLMDSVDLDLGGDEIPGGGDMDGAGSAWVQLSPATEGVCFMIKWEGLAGHVTAAHIHSGAAGATGPRYIDLFVGEDKPGGKGIEGGCVDVEDLGAAGHSAHGADGSPMAAWQRIQAVIDSPENYYLNLHTTSYPAGAVRSQF